MSSKQVKKMNIAPRQRLTREQRYQQLLEVAWRVIREQGTEALTLGWLAEQAGVTKPVVYDHFGTRAGLLYVLYREFDLRQTALMDEALQQSQPTLQDRAGVIASSYINCVLCQGREMPGVIAALTGSPELEKIKREYEYVFIEKCRDVLTPFTNGGVIADAGLWGMLGAAEALSSSAIRGAVTAKQAQEELFAIIVDMVARYTNASNNE